MSDLDYDVCVIGGGINGAGIARDAAGRGLSVLLLEADDLGGATSSASTKLIHGGLRYLEYYEFRLVREALKERETLLSLAPHIISPLSFVLPLVKGDQKQRPVWMIRLGLFLYDHLARRRELPGSGYVALGDDEYGAPLSQDYSDGFYYSDCWADDARLVVLNAMSAAQHGATILTRTTCERIVSRDGGGWDIFCRSVADSCGEDKEKSFQVTASVVINAAGPWVSDVIERSPVVNDGEALPKMRLVKGSHIIVKQQYEGEHAYILQQKDKRIVFAIPYENEYTLIGTTEEDFDDNPREAVISDDELAYLVDAYNTFFENTINEDDVLWSYSGVRPLFEDVDAENADSAHAEMRSISRDYKLHVHADGDGRALPLLSVFGGKLTTYRTLAEHAVDKISSFFDAQHKTLYLKHWTAREALPGGAFSPRDLKTTKSVAAFQEFVQQSLSRYDWLPETLVLRYARLYGSRISILLQNMNDISDLGEEFYKDLYEAEIVYLLRHEYACTAQDILWRRTKLGLHIAEHDYDNVVGRIDCFIAEYHADDIKKER